MHLAQPPATPSRSAVRVRTHRRECCKCGDPCNPALQCGSVHRTSESLNSLWRVAGDAAMEGTLVALNSWRVGVTHDRPRVHQQLPLQVLLRRHPRARIRPRRLVGLVAALEVVDLLGAPSRLGDALRRFARPSAFFTQGGFFSLIWIRVFWAIGPQVVGLVIGVFVGVALVLK